MNNFLAKKEILGWTAVTAEPDGLYGVTVLAPSESGGRPRVVKSGFIPDVDLNVESLSELSKKISVSGCPWVLSLSRGMYNLLVIPEPTVQQSELEQSVRWSIGTAIDSPVDEGSISFMKIPTTELLPNRPPHIYVAFAKNEIISRCGAIFQQAGIDLLGIDVRETAQRNVSVRAEEPEKGSALLAISEQGVRLTVSFNGALYLDRFIEESLFVDEAHDDNAKERAYERITLQLQRSLDFISRTLRFIIVDRILVVSTLGKLEHSDSISQLLQMPVETLNLAGIFDFSNTPELLEEEAQPRYFTVLGAALRFADSSQQLNLQTRRERSGLGAIWLELSILGAVLVSLLGLWGIKQLDVATAQKEKIASELQLQAVQAKLQAQTLRSAAKPETEVEMLKRQAKAAQDILNQAVTLGSPRGYAHYFSLLATLAEQDLWLTNVAIDRTGKSIHISGRAIDKENVLRYAERLNATFANDGVKFTALELATEHVGTQVDQTPRLAVVFFRLY